MEEILSSSCDIEVFTRSKLIIKRVSPAEMVNGSKDHFLENAQLFRQIGKTGFSETDLVLPFCFNEATGKVQVDLNQFLPYIYVLVEKGTQQLMAHGQSKNYFKVANPPIFKADIVSFCEHILQGEDILPAGTDVMTFFATLGLHGDNQDDKLGAARELNDVA